MNKTMKSLAGSWVAFLMAIAASDSLADGSVVVSSIAPRDIVLSDIKKTGTSYETTVEYTLENTTKEMRVVSRFCTIKVNIKIKDHDIPLIMAGCDGARKISPSDIVTVEPGGTIKFTVRVHGVMGKDGTVKMMRGTENGMWWASSPLPVPGEIELFADYDNSLAESQIKELFPQRLRHTMSEKITFPSVKINVTE